MALVEEKETIEKTVADLQTVEDQSGEDEELIEMARLEREQAESDIAKLHEDIIKKITPVDDADDHGIVLEVSISKGRSKSHFRDIINLTKGSRGNWWSGSISIRLGSI